MGIDMHKDGERCFLNTYVCSDYIKNEQLVPTKDYSLHVKVTDENTRRLQEHGRSLNSAQVRHLLAAQDPGISWKTLLRFKSLPDTKDPLVFHSGGEFKLCFCDSSLLGGTNEICDGPEDFTIEVGRVHATGLQCLLSNPKMTRGTCEEQMYGGLRCYDDAAPEVSVPSDFMGVPNPKVEERSKVAKALIAFCQFAPEEDTLEFSFCAQYRVYASEEATSSTGRTQKGP